MSDRTPDDKPPSFQDLILNLQRYWADQGCVILHPMTWKWEPAFHPATVLRALGPEPWHAAYVQPSRRPTDGRYGENPNRFRHYYQFQVILSPRPTTSNGFISTVCKCSALTRWRMIFALSKMIGKARLWALGGLAGKCGATAWKCRNLPISSKSAALIVSLSQAN